MSAPTDPGPDPAAPSASAPSSSSEAMATPPALEQDTSGSPKDFGLNVRRLRRTRIITFAVLALPLLALLLLAVKFLSMPITQAGHRSAYENGDYPAAIERLAPVEVANWFEPYLPHLSTGTSLLQQGENEAAEEELRAAMGEWDDHSDLNSPLHAQCKIANNLAISIERQADEIEDAQQRADRLHEAEELLAVCASSGGGGEGEGEGEGGSGEGEDGTGNEDSETTEENGERVEEKRREADEEAGNDPADRDEQGEGSPPPAGDPTREDPEGDGPDEEAPTDGSDEQQEKDDELEERNKDAQGGEGEDEPGDTEQDPNKPW